MTHRRSFIQHLAVSAGALTLSDLMAQTGPDWKKQIGLELYTVRDVLPKDYEGVLAKVAEIGYKEVEPADPYNNMEPKQYRALLDRYGLTMPSTHSGATDGPNLEKQLEGFQIMGIQYTEVRGGGGGGGTAGRGAAGRGQAGAAGGAARAAGAPAARPVESAKRQAADLNKYGAIVKKFGMKMLIHNHSGEFELLDDGKQTQYDVLLAETNPELVAMQLDIGWASVAGQNILEMFAKHPGRFELWHVKDALGIKSADPKLSPTQRQRAAKLVPVGLGDVDYRPIFAAAKQAGMRHFVIEQDNAAEWGDSVAAARVSFQNLTKILS
jgi:sugar phosphate isomerase/epimerase